MCMANRTAAHDLGRRFQFIQVSINETPGPPRMPRSPQGGVARNPRFHDAHGAGTDPVARAFARAPNDDVLRFLGPA